MKNVKRNWKTTVLGLLTLVFLGLGVYSNPNALFDPQGQAQITAGAAAGIGLILAKDGDQPGAEEPKS